MPNNRKSYIIHWFATTPITAWCEVNVKNAFGKPTQGVVKCEMDASDIKTQKRSTQECNGTGRNLCLSGRRPTGSSHIGMAWLEIRRATSIEVTEVCSRERKLSIHWVPSDHPKSGKPYVTFVFNFEVDDQATEPEVLSRVRTSLIPPEVERFDRFVAKLNEEKAKNSLAETPDGRCGGSTSPPMLDTPASENLIEHIVNEPTVTEPAVTNNLITEDSEIVEEPAVNVPVKDSILTGSGSVKESVVGDAAVVVGPLPPPPPPPLLLPFSSSFFLFSPRPNISKNVEAAELSSTENTKNVEVPITRIVEGSKASVTQDLEVASVSIINTQNAAKEPSLKDQEAVRSPDVSQKRTREESEPLEVPQTKRLRSDTVATETHDKPVPKLLQYVSDEEDEDFESKIADIDAEIVIWATKKKYLEIKRQKVRSISDIRSLESICGIVASKRPTKIIEREDSDGEDEYNERRVRAEEDLPFLSTYLAILKYKKTYLEKKAELKNLKCDCGQLSADISEIQDLSEAFAMASARRVIDREGLRIGTPTSHKAMSTFNSKTLSHGASPSAFATSASTSLFRRLTWEGTVPIEVHIDPKELPANSDRGLESYYIQAPRVSYLPLLIPEIKRFLTDLVLDDAGNMSVRESDWWFEGEDGHPIKWHWPIGLLYDCHTISLSTQNNLFALPLRMTLHLASPPIDKLLLSPSQEACKQAFMGQLKEVDFLRWGNTKRVTGLRKAEQDGIWDGIKDHNFDNFWRVASKICPSPNPSQNTPSSSQLPSSTLPRSPGPEQSGLPDSAYNVRNIPFRVYLPDGPVLQELVSPITDDGQPLILGKFLTAILPLLFPENGPPLAYALIQGIVCPPDAEVAWLSACLSGADGWLNICIGLGTRKH